MNHVSEHVMSGVRELNMDELEMVAGGGVVLGVLQPTLEGVGGLLDGLGDTVEGLIPAVEGILLPLEGLGG